MTTFRRNILALVLGAVIAGILLIVDGAGITSLTLLAFISFCVFLISISIEKNARQTRRGLKVQKEILGQLSLQKSTSISILSRVDEAAKLDSSDPYLKKVDYRISEIGNSLKENQQIFSKIVSDQNNNELRLRQIGSQLNKLISFGEEFKSLNSNLNQDSQNNLAQLVKSIQSVTEDQRTNEIRLRQIGQIARSIEIKLSAQLAKNDEKHQDDVKNRSKSEVIYKILEDLYHIRISVGNVQERKNLEY